jgi:ankyrin repeat protein
LPKEKIINSLLDRNADINIQNKYGEAPLHRAVRFSNQEEIELLLLERGAKIDIANNNGKTPLSYTNVEVNTNANYDLQKLLNGAKKNKSLISSNLT